MKESTYDKILAWLDGSMTPDERKAFELAMQQDEALAAEVALAKSALAAQQEADVLVLREQLREIMDEEPAPNPGSSSSKTPRNLIIATLAIAGLLLLVFWFWKRNQNTPPPQPPALVAGVFEKYFVTPENTLLLEPIERYRTETEEDSLRAQADKWIVIFNDNFSDKNLTAAHDALEALKKIEPDTEYISKMELMVFEGILQLQAGNPEEAISIFDEVEKIKPTEQAQWYRAGALLAAGQKEAAISQLEKIIAQPSHPRKNDATKILGEIKGK